MVHACWWYYFSKFTEFFDTVRYWYDWYFFFFCHILYSILFSQRKKNEKRKINRSFHWSVYLGNNGLYDWHWNFFFLQFFSVFVLFRFCFLFCVGFCSFSMWHNRSFSYWEKRIAKCQRFMLFIMDVCQCRFGLVLNSLLVNYEFFYYFCFVFVKCKVFFLLTFEWTISSSILFSLFDKL